MNPRSTLTLEESRILRREAKGLGNLVRLGYITITDKGQQWAEREIESISKKRRHAGAQGGAAKKGHKSHD